MKYPLHIHEAVVYHSIAGRFAIRQDHWKMEFCPGSDGWGIPGDAAAKKQCLPDAQLDDLSADLPITGLHHQRNEERASRHCDIAERLTRLLEQTIANGRSTPGPKQANDVPTAINNPNNKTPKDQS